MKGRKAQVEATRLDFTSKNKANFVCFVQSLLHLLSILRGGRNLTTRLVLPSCSLSRLGPVINAKSYPLGMHISSSVCLAEKMCMLPKYAIQKAFSSRYRNRTWSGSVGPNQRSNSVSLSSEFQSLDMALFPVQRRVAPSPCNAVCTQRIKSECSNVPCKQRACQTKLVSMLFSRW